MAPSPVWIVDPRQKEEVAMRINKLLKRVLALALVFCMMLTTVPAAFAAADGQFQDVHANHWAYPYIQDVVSQGLFQGTSANRFSPEGTMTRGMLAVVLSRVAKVTVDNDAATGFRDVPAGQWYTGAVAWAAGQGIIQGLGNGTFGPTQPVTREQAATMLVRYTDSANLALSLTVEQQEFSDGSSIREWARDAVRLLQMAGVLAGYPDGSFRPTKSITRAEAAKILSVLLDSVEQVPVPTEPPVTEPPVTDPPPTEPPVTDPPPTDPPEPITVTFTGSFCTVLVNKEAVTQVTLEPGCTSLEFVVETEPDHEIYEVRTSSGVLASQGRNYVLGQLTGDTTVEITAGLEKHTVTFDPCNGAPTSSVKVIHGETVARPEDPVKADDTFQGWFTAAGEAWDFSAPVMQNMTLYANWLNDSYAETVLYLDGVRGNDQNDGLTPETALKTFAKAQAMMPAKVRDGIIYIVDTVTVTGTEAWDMGGKDCTIMRWSDCLNDMIDILSGSLTLSNLVIDGNRDNINLGTTALGHCLYVTGTGELTIQDGTVIQNNYHFKGQGGAIYIYRGGKVTMNGGQVTRNESGYTGGAIGISTSSDPELACSFIMNGGEITENRSGSLGGAIAASSGYMYLELNGGLIAGNVTKSPTSAAIYHGSKYGYLKVTGGAIRDNVTADGDVSSGIYTSYGIGSIDPAPGKTLSLGNDLLVNNNNTSSGKLVYFTTSTGLANLDGSLPVQLKKLYVGATVLAGADGYVLTQADLEKVHLCNDIEGAYLLELDEELNQIALAEIPNHDVIVYLNGASGKDTNDGLTVKTPVKTLEKAKTLLKERAAAENLPEGASYVISLAGKVTLQESAVLTFADFGDLADRCMIRRDATFSSGQMFSVDGCDITLEDVTIDGNLAFIKDNSGSMFDLINGATVTVNDGTVIRNFYSRNSGGLFYLNSSTKRGGTALTFNGGHIYHVSGGGGAIAYLWGNESETFFNSSCVVNDLLLEDCTCSNGMFYLSGGDLTFNGGTFRNNTATTAGSIASVRVAGEGKLVFNPASEGKTMSLEGDVFLMNTRAGSNGNVLLEDRCVVYLNGPLSSKLGITATLSLWNTPVVQGLDYTLTESDLAQVYMTSGDALKLNTATNQILITKVTN